MFFNINDDPGELEDFTGKKPGLSRKLMGLIADNLKKANEAMRDER